MSGGRIKLEPGTRHVLAYCTGCPSWRELASSSPAALRVSATHAELVHGDSATAKELRRRARDTLSISQSG
jgi:hypothetical protein